MSGEMERAPKLELNEIIFNGKKNTFFYVNRKGGLIEKDGKKMYEKTELGESVNVIFLRIRRKLRMYRKGQSYVMTNEHNTKHDMLTLFEDSNIIKGTNDQLKEKYGASRLKTVQIVYALLSREGAEPELVRLVVKGASLGSEAKGKGVEDFYSYIGGFKKDNKDEHFYEYVTKLYGIAEEGEQGEYYAMTFERGSKLSDAQIDTLVATNMKTVFDFVTASDAYYKTKNVEEITKDTKADGGEDVIEYPDDDVNSEDIPF